MVSKNIKSICKYLIKYQYGYKKPELFINLTYKCPLRCKFCYVDYNKSEDFSLDDLEYLFEHGILQSHFIKLVTFFGGEPLLKFEYIKHLLEKYYDDCCKKNIHLAVITSMAVYSTEILSLQKKYPYFEIIISYDKFSENRVNANGKVYNIFETLKPEMFLENKRNICFHTVIDNYKSLLDLQDLQNNFKKYGLLYSWCWNKTPKYDFDMDLYYNCLKFIIEENNYYPKQFVKEVMNYLYLNNNGCGIGSELFISSNGIVTPCSISHYNDDFILLKNCKDMEKLEKIQYFEDNIFNNKYCLNCNIKGFCNGGCLIDRIKNFSFEKPNYNLCNIMKKVFEIYKKIDEEYDLKKISYVIDNQKLGNIDYCYNTHINIDMYDYFNIKEM